jgi:hypothetical protein
MKIRKLRAGTDSFGNTWENDDDVIDVDPEQAAHLLAIPDGGFELVEDHEHRAQAPVHNDAGKGLPDGVEAGHGARQAAGKPEGREEGDGRPVQTVDTPVVAGDGSGRRARTAATPKSAKDPRKDEANTANEGKDQGVPAPDAKPGR